MNRVCADGVVNGGFVVVHAGLIEDGLFVVAVVQDSTAKYLDVVHVISHDASEDNSALREIKSLIVFHMNGTDFVNAGAKIQHVFIGRVDVTGGRAVNKKVQRAVSSVWFHRVKTGLFDLKTNPAVG